MQGLGLHRPASGLLSARTYSAVPLLPPQVVLIAPAPARDAAFEARLSVLAKGRRDGNRSNRAAHQRRRRQRIRESDDVGISSNWWEEDGRLREDVFSADVSPQQPQQRIRKASSDDDEEEGQGWWERPEERSLQAYMPGALEPWQEVRLEQACTLGRRKIEVQSLAQELNLDRTTVLYWVKEFWKKPELERNAILARRSNELQEAAAKQGRLEVLQAVQGGASQATKGVKGEGFIPFYTRKEMGLTDSKNKKLSANALRTMESVYTRTPFPSGDVIDGLWDLHRISRETALQWFVARREQDGILSSEQKRRAKDPSSRVSRKLGPMRFDDDNLLVEMGEPAPEPETPQPPQQVVVSSKQLAQLRSSLPSPNKYKGKQIAEKMGINSDGSVLQVGNVQYVQQDESSNSKKTGMPARKWASAWRRRRAAAPRPTLPLLAKSESEEASQDSSNSVQPAS